MGRLILTDKLAILQTRLCELVRVVVDGSNADDRFDYRPGMKANRELGILSPLQETGFT